MTSRVLWTFRALLALRKGICTAKQEGHGASAGTEPLPDYAGCIGANSFPQSVSYLTNPARQCAATGATSEHGGESQALPLGLEASSDSLHLLFSSMKTRPTRQQTSAKQGN